MNHTHLQIIYITVNKEKVQLLEANPKAFAFWQQATWWVKNVSDIIIEQRIVVEFL